MTAMSSPAATPAEADPRWASVLARDPAQDGAFVYAVSTTGVYCRPSCPSRAARRAHVSFHAGPEQARAAGFRACLRCAPDGPSPDARRAAVVARACRALEAAVERGGPAPALAELARTAGLSPHHFHRTFKATVGATPAAYAAALRARRVRDGLGGGEGVTRAVYAAGYGSSGRFYAGADDVLGMTPGRYRDGGRGERIAWAVGEGALGQVLAARSARGVCAILMGDDAEALRLDLLRRFPFAELAPGGEDFAEGLARVLALVEHPAQACDLPLDIRGTAFQARVWRALQAIPAGATADYAQVAASIGAPRSARAVAAACAANALAVAVPCHRVVRRDGALSGYRWGVERKRELLARERGG